jgi:D-alanine transaminase
LDVRSMYDTVYFNYSYMSKADVRISPDDRGFLFADGVYEVIIAYGGRYFRKQDHLERLSNSLRALRISGLDPMSLDAVVEQLLVRNGADEADVTVYIQVTRGAAQRKHSFPNGDVAPTVYAQLMPFARKVDMERGESVITLPDTRWSRCDIKSVALLPNCLANQQAHEQGCIEAILVRDGFVLEGTHSSFFAVIDGMARTAPRSNYILPSVTRRVVLEICRREGIPCSEETILLQDLDSAGEMFLAGTTTEIAPITQCDGRAVGTGRPGPFVQRLAELFSRETTAAAAGTATATHS